MRKVSGRNMRVGCAALFIFIVATIGASAQTFTTLARFDGTDGAFPYATLVQGLDGVFYGAAYDGGTPESGGTVFEITAAGKLTTLYTFCSQFPCDEGYAPNGLLVQATNGNFYGTTVFGGSSDYCPNQSGCGTVFEITPAGKLTTLYSFCPENGCDDGYSPNSLVQAINGNFYGTTGQGGENNNAGTIFEITSAGKLTTIHSFCSQGGYPDCVDGSSPDGLVQGANGNLYGTTEWGGLMAVARSSKLLPQVS
jgi:uncharacterized repeat protein (TIGR03803 family)